MTRRSMAMTIPTWRGTSRRLRPTTQTTVSMARWRIFLTVWVEDRDGALKLRPNRRNRIPRPVTVGHDGRPGASGERFWFIAGKYAFCIACLDAPHGAARERSKLAGLTAEGRSSATTMLVSSALEWMNRADHAVPQDKRKLLGFTDNRQDAALQAGHFNDFLFVSLLRGAILRAVLDSGEDGLRDDEFGYRVQRALGFTGSNRALRSHWMLNPEAGVVICSDAERSLAKVLAHRVWTDLRRGWRFTNPNLSTLKLIEVDFAGLDEVAADVERLGAILAELGSLDLRPERVLCIPCSKRCLKALQSAAKHWTRRLSTRSRSAHGRCCGHPGPSTTRNPRAKERLCIHRHRAAGPSGCARNA